MDNKQVYKMLNQLEDWRGKINFDDTVICPFPSYCISVVDHILTEKEADNAPLFYHEDITKKEAILYLKYESNLMRFYIQLSNLFNPEIVIYSALFKIINNGNNCEESKEDFYNNILQVSKKKYEQLIFHSLREQGERVSLLIRQFHIYIDLGHDLTNALYYDPKKTSKDVIQNIKQIALNSDIYMFDSGYAI